MTDEPREAHPEAATTRSSPGLPIFLIVALLLATVVGGAMLMNSGTSDQAGIEQPSNSATGASSGEAGSGPSAVPDKKPESAPAPQR